MEWFAVGHEYGHGLANHRVEEASAIDAGSERLEQIAYLQGQEYEADAYGLLIAAGLGQLSGNPFAATGTGAVVILAGLEMVLRARQILRTGNDILPGPRVHPSSAERRFALNAAVTEFFPKEMKTVSQMRADFEKIMEALWAELREFFFELHGAGVRPLSEDFPKIDPSTS
jgi:hypothetical protein